MNYCECLARLEEQVKSIKETIGKHMATKKDVADVKIWVLSGVLGGMGVAAGLTVIIVKAFFA